MNTSIGIGITTFGRTETAQIAIRNIIDRSTGCPVVVVADVPGIAKAKNECLAELDKCEHIFLFDDDTYPLVDGWFLPYIYSGVAHLSFTFAKLCNGMSNGNRRLIKSAGDCNVYQNPCGCMMYIHNSCLKAVGGFDEQFIGWGYEHVNYSQRVYNAGLTPHPFMDVKNSLELLHSMDYYREIGSSVEPRRRAAFIKHNRPIYEREQHSKEFKAYK